jgi:Xaa-Pro aminopeptidase
MHKENIGMSFKPYTDRLNRFRQLMEERELDSFLIAVPENRYYLSGYQADDLLLTESSGSLLITRNKQLLLTDFRYEEAAKQEALGFEVLIYKEGLATLLPDVLADLDITRLGLEAHYLTYQRYSEVEKALRAARPHAEVVAVEGLVEQMRVVKEPLEIDRIKASLRVTERVLAAVWETLATGRTEKDVAWEIERRIREQGAESVSFPPIAASGPNAALPHAVPGERRIGPGELVILDLGSRLDHYCSDMTRTWSAGGPEARLREIYRVVREAQRAAQESIRAGKDSHEVDGVAREFIRQAGYGDHFGHGLGHGVGLAVHEKPGFGKQTRMVLEENMVVTVEPGIYLPSYGGVRLENMVRVTGTGCEILNELDLFYDY